MTHFLRWIQKQENTTEQHERIMQGRTTIIISHRVSSAKLAHKIVVLADGVIAESGTHDTPVTKNGLYKELYEKQVQLKKPADDTNLESEPTTNSA